jgi:hypothetical protein
MPFSRRTGKRYAAGSSSTAPPEYPRVCDLCHERILVSKTGFEQRADLISGRWRFRARHLTCPPFRNAA